MGRQFDGERAPAGYKTKLTHRLGLDLALGQAKRSVVV
jgi:hypothetical protein